MICTYENKCSREWYRTRQVSNEKSNEIMRHNIYPVVRLLAGNLVHVVMTHSLGGSRTNRHHTPNPTQEHHKNQHNRGYTSHEQFTRVAFCDLKWGVGTRTPYNHHDWNQGQPPPSAQRYRCSKPSRWRQWPRVTRIHAAHMITTSLVPLDAQTLSNCN
jgi:hypothetical protein